MRVLALTAWQQLLQCRTAVAACYRLAVAATPLSVCLRRVVVIAVVPSPNHVFSIIIPCRRPADTDERLGHDCLTILDVGSGPDRYLLSFWRCSCNNFVGFCLGWASAMLCSLARPCVSGCACLRVLLVVTAHIVTAFEFIRNILFRS